MPRKTVSKETSSTTECCVPIKDKCSNLNCHSGGAVYGLGLVGALVYYIGTATGFWNGCLGVIKAVLWPGFLVFELLKYLRM